MVERKPVEDMLPAQKLVRARRALAHAQGELREAEQILRYRQFEILLLEQEVEEAEARASDPEELRRLRTRKAMLEETLLTLAQYRQDKLAAVEEWERVIYQLRVEQHS